jgi:hypothetical protein
MRRTLVLLAAFSFVFAFASCGDDGPDIDPEADQELVDDAVLTADDLPDGFEAQPDDDGDDDNECNADVLDIDADDLDDAKTAESDAVVFQGSNIQGEVRAQVTAFRDTELPERVLDALGDDEYLDCIRDGIAGELEAGDVDSIEEIDSPVDGGRAVALHLTVPGPDGEDIGIDAQQHAVLVDRFGITLQLTALGGELDEDLAEELLDTMIDRIEDEIDA